MTAPAFVHLRLHSEYSIVDGMVRIDDAVGGGGGGRDARAGAHRPRQCLRPRQVLQGGARARASSRSSAATSGSRTTPSATSRFALLLLAQSRAGYLKLADWLTRAYREQPAPRPRRAPARMVRRRHRRPDRAVRRARRRRRPGAAAGQRRRRGARRRAIGPRCFPDRYYLEVQRAGHADDDALVAATVRLAARARAAGRRDASGAVPAPRGFPRARGARLHRRGLRARRPAAAAALHAGAVFQDRRRRWRRRSPTCPRRSRTRWRSRSAAT